MIYKGIAGLKPSSTVYIESIKESENMASSVSTNNYFNGEYKHKYEPKKPNREDLKIQNQPKADYNRQVKTERTSNKIPNTQEAPIDPQRLKKNLRNLSQFRPHNKSNQETPDQCDYTNLSRKIKDKQKQVINFIAGNNNENFQAKLDKFYKCNFKRQCDNYEQKICHAESVDTYIKEVEKRKNSNFHLWHKKEKIQPNLILERLNITLDKVDRVIESNKDIILKRAEVEHEKTKKTWINDKALSYNPGKDQNSFGDSDDIKYDQYGNQPYKVSDTKGSKLPLPRLDSKFVNKKIQKNSEYNLFLDDINCEAIGVKEWERDRSWSPISICSKIDQENSCIQLKLTTGPGENTLSKMTLQKNKNKAHGVNEKIGKNGKAVLSERFKLLIKKRQTGKAIFNYNSPFTSRPFCNTISSLSTDQKNIPEVKRDKQVVSTNKNLLLDARKLYTSKTELQNQIMQNFPMNDDNKGYSNRNYSEDFVLSELEDNINFGIGGWGTNIKENEDFPKKKSVSFKKSYLSKTFNGILFFYWLKINQGLWSKNKLMEVVKITKHQKIIWDLKKIPRIKSRTQKATIATL